MAERPAIIAGLRAAASRHRHEAAVGVALAALLALLAVAAPDFFTLGNLRDLCLNNAPVLVVAIGMTFIILAGHIDISVGAHFALCSVAAGWFAKAGAPAPALAIVVMAVGGALGALNGGLVAYARIPSIVVTLAAMVAWRDGLRWSTGGAWVQGLPPTFQWFGLGQSAGGLVVVGTALAVFGLAAWCARSLAAGRAVYATGSDAEAARLAGIRPRRVVFWVFAAAGVLTGLAALLNSVRFADVQGSAGIGLEMKVIAAAVVGGTAVTGGRGTLAGTLLGVALLGTIGTALTYLGVNPYWERAIQGAIILAAVISDALVGRAKDDGRVRAAAG
jgi:rhamnose transport system permease protein